TRRACQRRAGCGRGRGLRRCGAVLLVCPRRIAEALGHDRIPLGVDKLAGFVAGSADAPLDDVIAAAGENLRHALGRERYETDLAAVAVRRRPA
ncbi:MAG: hypothetical protein AAFU70_11420, partial [Planctomycetota bacterium]